MVSLSNWIKETPGKIQEDLLGVEQQMELFQTETDSILTLLGKGQKAGINKYLKTFPYFFEKSLYKPELWGNDLFNVGLSEQLEKKFNVVSEHNINLSKMIFDELGIENNEEVSLFESSGAVTLLDTDGIVKDSFFTEKNNLINSENDSNVSIQYKHTLFKYMSYKKAIFSFIINAIPMGSPIQVSLIQEYLKTALPKDNHFRGAYKNFENGMTSGSSGISVSEEITEKILNKYFPSKSLEEISTILGCGRVDLLAGIFDELFSRLMIHDEYEWEEQVIIIAEEIRIHGDKGTLGLLC